MHKHNIFFATKLWLCNNVYFLFREMSLRIFCFFNAKILSEFSSFLCFCFSTLPSLLTYCSLVNWVFIHIYQLPITTKTTSIDLLTYLGKVKKILKGSLDSISSPSVKIQIVGRKVCLRRKGKTLLAIVNKLFVFKSLLTTSNNVLPLHLSCPLFEFSLKVKVMGSNPGYLLKSFLLYV